MAQERQPADSQTNSNTEEAVGAESKYAIFAASVSASYMIVVLAFGLWLVTDIFGDQHRFLRWLGTAKPIPILLNNLVAAFVGGALGGIINELRSLLVWHAERRAYGTRFIWKGITAPWIGGGLALFAVALVTGGVSVLGAEISSDANKPTPSLAFFAIGAMAGYGSRDVCKWLDGQVKKLFVPSEEVAIVPDTLGMTLEDATKLLADQKLQIGNIAYIDTQDANEVGKIKGQSVANGTKVSASSRVDVTITKKAT